MSEITRRRLLQGSGAVLAGLALAGCQADPTHPAEAIHDIPTGGGTPPVGSRPNILVFLADDLGFSDVGCFGSEIATPNLDRLARTGRRFSNMHNNPRCCPSRATLLTGLYPTQAGVGDMTGNQGTPAYQGYLNHSCVTIAEALGEVGYRSAISGKWHVAPRSRLNDWPAERGFERSYCQMGGGDYYRPTLYRDGSIIGTPTDPDFYLTTAITSNAIDSIRTFARGADPFFMYVGYKNPHFPLQAPEPAIEPYRGKYAMGWDELRVQRWERTKATGVVNPIWELSKPAQGTVRWDTVADKEWQAARMEVYAAQVTLMDEGIGQILDTLEQLGLRENTLVLFLSDNGACAEVVKPRKHGNVPTANGLPMQSGNIPGLFPGPSNTYQSYGIDWANASNSPFRKYKRWTEEGGISTPLIASWPGTVSAGGLDDRFIHIIDLMPTFLSLAGAPYPTTYAGDAITPLEGHSFVAALADVPGWSRPGACFWEHMGHRAARHGRWKVVSDQPTGPFELFDMTEDRTEVHNVASQHRDITRQLGAEWESWKVRTGVRTWSPRTHYRPN